MTLLSISAVSATSAFASLPDESHELFSIAQRTEVVRSIDDACADSWCEGDYNFKFVKLSCDKFTSSCDLSFHFIKSDDQSVETFSKLQVCHFENIRNFKQLKDSMYSLNEKFYDDLTECIGNRQNEVQF